MPIGVLRRPIRHEMVAHDPKLAFNGSDDIAPMFRLAGFDWLQAFS